jgi:hypothetical protein
LPATAFFNNNKLQVLAEVHEWTRDEIQYSALFPVINPNAPKLRASAQLLAERPLQIEYSPRLTGVASRAEMRKRISAQQRHANRWLNMFAMDLGEKHRNIIW